MPFDTFAIDLTCFLSLITLLVSLPTEPYYHHSWQRPESYRLVRRPFNQGPLRRNDQRIEGRILPALEPQNITRSGSESRSSENQPPMSQNPNYQDARWYQLDERTAQTDLPQNNRGFDAAYAVTGEDSLGTNVYGGTDNYGVENFNSSYSSHVIYGRENQNDEELEESSKFSGIVDGSRGSVDREVINFEENSRNFRRGGNTRKGGTNTISTTEKIVRTQTQKGSKRPPRPSPSTKPQSSQIVFPDVYPRQKFTPRGTKCGKKTTFCEHIGEEYPSDYINQILRKEGAMFREFFGKDVIRDPNITERIHAPEENSLCPFRQEVVFPRAAKNKEDKWLFVVNQDQYVQGVTVEVCLNPESRCILTEGFPLGYVPYCKQKYIERRLVAIGEDGKPHSDSFRLPSCCSCVVKHETSARFGSLMTPRNTSPTANKTRPKTNS